METTWVEVAGLTIRTPVTAGTNLLLAVQCFVYFRVLRAGRGARAKLWSGFFLMMSVATLAGVAKHGLGHDLPPAVLLLVLWISSITGGVSTYFAQRATVVSYAPASQIPRWDSVLRMQLALFLAANLVIGPAIVLLIANTALGMLPVIAVELRASARGLVGAAWVAGGLSLSIATGAVYGAELSVGPWFTHVDIAHVIMGVSFWSISRGVRAPLVHIGGGSHGWLPVRTMTTDPGRV